LRTGESVGLREEKSDGERQMKREKWRDRERETERETDSCPSQVVGS